MRAVFISEFEQRGSSVCFIMFMSTKSFAHFWIKNWCRHSNSRHILVLDDQTSFSMHLFTFYASTIKHSSFFCLPLVLSGSIALKHEKTFWVKTWFLFFPYTRICDLLLVNFKLVFLWNSEIFILIKLFLLSCQVVAALYFFSSVLNDRSLNSCHVRTCRLVDKLITATLSCCFCQIR